MSIAKKINGGNRPPLQLLLRQSCSSQDRQHQEATDQSKRRHEIKIPAPASIEQMSEKQPGQAAAEVLKRIDQPGGEPGHPRAANIHCCSRSENRVCRIDRE